MIRPPLSNLETLLQGMKNLFHEFSGLPLEMHSSLNDVKAPASRAANRFIEDIHHPGMSTSQKKRPAETAFHQKGEIILEGIRYPFPLLIPYL